MAKKINFTKNIMEQVNAAIKAVQDKEAQVSIMVSKNQAPNAPADKLVCMISCINSNKESVELAFNIDKPKDFADGDAPYLNFTVNAEAFTQQTGALLLRGQNITLTEEKSTIKLTSGTAVSKVPLVEESEFIKGVRGEVIYKNNETQLSCTLDSKKAKAAMERCLSAVNPAAVNLTIVSDSGELHLYGFDSKSSQHAVLKGEGMNLKDTVEGGSSFAITTTVAKNLSAMTAGGKNFMLLIAPTKGCIGVRPTENMTLRYTFPLAAARLSDAILTQLGKMEADNCFARVVVDGEQMKGAVKFVSATNSKDTKVPVKLSIGVKSLTLTHGDAKVSVDLVEQEGSEQAEKFLGIALLNTVLMHEGNGNILISIAEKGMVAVRSGDLENNSDSIALLAPCKEPKAGEQTEEDED